MISAAGRGGGGGGVDLIKLPYLRDSMYLDRQTLANSVDPD